MNFKDFIRPDKWKVMITGTLILFVVISFLFRWDSIAYSFSKFPIKIFDSITFSRFAPKECFVFCFPTIPQALFLLVFDVLFIYAFVCIFYKMRNVTSQNIFI